MDDESITEQEWYEIYGKQFQIMYDNHEIHRMTPFEISSTLKRFNEYLQNMYDSTEVSNDLIHTMERLYKEYQSVYTKIVFQ